MPELPFTGLTPAQAEQSRTAHGSNRLTGRRRITFGRRWLQSFGDPIIKILLAALAINLLFLLRRCDWFESVGIAISVFAATFVSALSEHGSEAAFEKLQQQAETVTCRAIRGGKVIPLSAADVVVDDVILLQSGEKVPADGILLQGRLSVNQAMLSGESREVPKRADGSRPEEASVFAGTVVCGGEAVMQVQAVGDHTRLGQLAGEIREESGDSPLKQRLTGLAKTISRLGYGASALVMLADLFYSFGLSTRFSQQALYALFASPTEVLARLFHAVTLGITTLVVAVPEGLPMMITVVLSSNMRRMLKDQVLVRKPVGIETSGSLNILFTDKTGTLTKGEPGVVQCVTGNGFTFTEKTVLRRHKALWEKVSRNCFYNNESLLSARQILGGNATDRALLAYVLPQREPAGRWTVYGRLPFHSGRKYAAAVLGAAGQPALYPVKGAPERLLPACTRYTDEAGTVRPLRDREPLEAAMRQMTGSGMRVLALAEADREVPETGPLPAMTLTALLGIRDELRPEAAETVAQLRRAGIQLVMITGDNKETAVAIAAAAGLLDIRDGECAVLTGEQLRALSDAQIRKRLAELRVLARAQPEDKSRLLRLAQENGLVAGMTGDGINDAPALKKANVGFAMGSGTEVAKEAADIVILDDRLSSIAKAVLYGRTIFHSIRKFIVFQLTVNLCAVAVSVLGPFLGVDTPVTVVQMLWVNLIMDTLAGLAFAGEPPLEEYMKELPKRREEPIMTGAMLHQILWTGGFTVALCVAFLCLPATFFRVHPQDLYRMTGFFALFIFCGIFNCFNARTGRVNLLAHLHRNPAFVTIMLLVTTVQLCMIYRGGTLFRAAGLTLTEWSAVLRMAALVIPFDMARKLILRLRRKK
ncbi:MAG: calcium-translocating P-type ATPase, PMCA-type [Clostridia bacterium]|nr:calcium-translocating P-type ATPase, PMCA-type [Clostridia bacterium]